MSDEATFVGLMHEHVQQNKDYLSWVPAYKVARKLSVHDIATGAVSARNVYTIGNQRFHMVTVGGHYRRKALYGSLHRALPCVCKFEKL